jgi:tight adherence protein B
MGMEDVLRRAVGRIRIQEFRFFVVCLLVQQRTGAGLGATLSSLSQVIRQRRAADLKARALSAEPRASAAILSALPIIAGAALFLIDKPLISSLYLDPRGRVMLEVAIASLLTGIATITVLLRKKS